LKTKKKIDEKKFSATFFLLLLFSFFSFWACFDIAVPTRGGEHLTIRPPLRTGSEQTKAYFSRRLALVVRKSELVKFYNYSMEYAQNPSKVPNAERAWA
jgi:hypothetical protein